MSKELTRKLNRAPGPTLMLVFVDDVSSAELRGTRDIRMAYNRSIPFAMQSFNVPDLLAAQSGRQRLFAHDPGEAPSRSIAIHLCADPYELTDSKAKASQTTSGMSKFTPLTAL